MEVEEAGMFLYGGRSLMHPAGGEWSRKKALLLGSEETGQELEEITQHSG
jgi:hypothetical protein